MTDRSWPALDGNLHFLRQGITLLERLGDDTYASDVGRHSPVGAQYRHVLEHYQCLLAGVGGGRVDYDARARDPLIEQDRDHALQATRDLLQEIASLPHDPNRSLTVQMDCGGGGTCPEWSRSSLGRELQFLASHTVHHYALIALLLEALGEEVPAGLGVAPSTLTHQRAGR